MLSEHFYEFGMHNVDTKGVHLDTQLECTWHSIHSLCTINILWVSIRYQKQVYLQSKYKDIPIYTYFYFIYYILF